MAKKQTSKNTIAGIETYNVPEAASILGVSRKAVQQYAKAGKIRAVKVGRRWVITKQAIIEFVSGYKPEAKP